MMVMMTIIVTLKINIFGGILVHLEAPFPPSYLNF